MLLPSHWPRILCALLLLALAGGTPRAAAAASCSANPPPATIRNPFLDPGKAPTELPSAGGGGAADACANDPNCSGAPSGGFDSPDQPGGAALPALAGSAAGQGHGRLLMLVLPALPDQAAGCSQPAAPGGSPANLPGPAPPAASGGAGPPPGGDRAPAPPATPAPCPQPPAPPALPNPRDVAGTIGIPWPAFRVRAKPESVGLDGLPSWFWIEGYDGSPLTASRHVHLDGLPNPQAGCPRGAAADEEVAVRAAAFAYEWHFGDDLPTSSLATTSLGVPYPREQGAITHQYATTSAGSGHPDGFTVTVIAHFRVEYRTGGGWQTLAQADRRATLAYTVRQAYPVIVHP